MTPLTRDYFENHPQWKIENIPNLYKEFPDYIHWTATIGEKCEPWIMTHNYIEVENCMYEWKFCVNIKSFRGSGEGYMTGDIFVCSVEELETLFRIIHFDDYGYTQDFGKNMFSDVITGCKDIKV